MGMTINVVVRPFAALREAFGVARFEFALPEGCDVTGLLATLAAAYPGADLPGRRFTVAVNRAYAPPDTRLDDGDEIALIPPVSGGAGKLFEIVERPISIDEVAARVIAPDRGGIALFAGTVRGLSGTSVTSHLEYEAYAEMAEEVLTAIGAEARARFLSVSAISIVHRVGRLEIGEIAVVIAVAAAHREETFAACHFVIDRIKEVAPIWKHEYCPDGSMWVEGPESSVA